MFVWDGSKLDVYDTTNGLPSKAIFDVDVDAAGHVWVATQHGVAMLQDDVWNVALPSISGIADSLIQEIAVKGAPTMPAPDATPKTTSISGRISQAGKTVTNTQVELCSEGPFGSNNRNRGETPCANQYYSQLATTDDKGIYRFEDVPTGTYTLVFFSQKENKWVSFINLNIVALEPDEEVVQDVSID